MTFVVFLTNKETAGLSRCDYENVHFWVTSEIWLTQKQ